MAFLARLARFGARNIRGQPLFVAALAAAIGIFAGESIRQPNGWLTAFVLFTGLALLRKSNWPLFAAITCGFAAAHAWQIQGQQTFPVLSALLAKEKGLWAEVEGIVADQPTTSGEVTRFPLRLSRLRVGEQAFACTHPIMIMSLAAPPRYGQRLRLVGQMTLPPSARNPGEFDYRQHLWRKGCPAIMRLWRPEQQAVLESFAGNRVKSWAVSARENIRQAITRDLPPGHRASITLEAVVLGIQHEIPVEVEDAFRHSGTLHLFSVSGLHVGIIGACLWLLAGPFRLSRRAKVALVVPLMFVYAFITGWQPPAVRSAIMASVFLGAFVFDRQARTLNSLGAAAFFVLGLETNDLFTPSFQLSFGIVLAMVALTQPLQRPFRRFTQHDPFLPTSLVPPSLHAWFACCRVVVGSVCVSLAASLGSLPLVLGHFRLATPSGILANAILIPLSFSILFAALLSLFCRAVPLLGWANILFNNANFGQATLLIWLANSFATMPGAYRYVSLRPDFLRAPCEVTVLDLPEGGALHHLYVKGHGNHLVDAAHYRDFAGTTRPYLRAAGISRLDALWLTHADVGHIGGVPHVLAEYRPRELLQSSWEGRGPSVTAVRRALEISPPAVRRTFAGERIPLGGNVEWEVLYPPEDARFRPSGADNQCLVLRLRSGPWRILFTSDSGFATERWLLDSGSNLSAHVLIKGQHRADASDLPEFLQAVSPTVIVADLESAPGASWIAWAKERQVQVIDQRATGAVRLELRPEELRLVPFLGKQTLRIPLPAQ